MTPDVFRLLKAICLEEQAYHMGARFSKRPSRPGRFPQTCARFAPEAVRFSCARPWGTVQRLFLTRREATLKTCRLRRCAETRRIQTNGWLPFQNRQLQALQVSHPIRRTHGIGCPFKRCVPQEICAQLQFIPIETPLHKCCHILDALHPEKELDPRKAGPASRPTFLCNFVDGSRQLEGRARASAHPDAIQSMQSTDLSVQNPRAINAMTDCRNEGRHL